MLCCAAVQAAGRGHAVVLSPFTPNKPPAPSTPTSLGCFSAVCRQNSVCSTSMGGVRCESRFSTSI